jgi:hypothetical protein
MTTPCLMFDPLPDHEHGQDPRTRTVKRSVRAKHALSRIVPRSSYGCAVPGINLNDYSRLPDAKGWGPACQQGRLTITLSNGVRLTVASAIAELVLLVMNEIIRRGYVIRAGDTGAYNCRKIAGTNVWSNHAWAIAIDLNWTTNPYTTGTTHDIPGWVVQLFNRYGFAWGGDYSGSKRDYMHFEFMGNFPTQAAAATALARQELGSGNPTPPTPPPPVDPTAQVKQDQLDLTDTGFPCVADGVWGPASIQACKNFQYSAAPSPATRSTRCRAGATTRTTAMVVTWLRTGRRRSRSMVGPSRSTTCGAHARSISCVSIRPTRGSSRPARATPRAGPHSGAP